MRNKEDIKMKCIQDIVEKIDHSKKLMSGSISIREAIYAYQLVKSISIKKDYLDTVFNTALSIIIPMNNGVRIFIDTHPEVDFLKEKFPLEMPNKNGIFKRISGYDEEGCLDKNWIVGLYNPPEKPSIKHKENLQNKMVCKHCGGTGFVQIWPNVRGIKKCPYCK